MAAISHLPQCVNRRRPKQIALWSVMTKSTNLHSRIQHFPEDKLDNQLIMETLFWQYPLNNTKFYFFYDCYELQSITWYTWPELGSLLYKKKKKEKKRHVWLCFVEATNSCQCYWHHSGLPNWHWDNQRLSYCQFGYAEWLNHTIVSVPEITLNDMGKLII